MKENVWISIDGRQEPESSLPEFATLYTSGFLTKRGSNYVASYDESELTGMSRTRTEVEIAPDSVSLRRIGLFPSNLVFQKGRRLNSMIDNGFGLVDMTLSTPTLNVNMNDDGGTVDLKYDLEIEHSHVGGGRLHIDIRKLGE